MGVRQSWVRGLGRVFRASECRVQCSGLGSRLQEFSGFWDFSDQGHGGTFSNAWVQGLGFRCLRLCKHGLLGLPPSRAISEGPYMQTHFPSRSPSLSLSLALSGCVHE